MSICLHMVRACDRQTDRRTDGRTTPPLSKSHSIAERNKNASLLDIYEQNDVKILKKPNTNVCIKCLFYVHALLLALHYAIEITSTFAVSTFKQTANGGYLERTTTSH